MDKNRKFDKVIATVICLFICCSYVHAENKKEVINILTWWEYLDDKIVDTAEKKCNVKISYDEYYNNDEFIRRWSAGKEDYQVIIFSQTIYNIVKDKLPRIKNSKLNNNIKYYNPVIRNHYLQKNYPENVAYFTHSLTGFLWNPENIYISSNDSIDSIFKKAKNNNVVIIDDPEEFKKLIGVNLASNRSKFPQNNALTIESFKKITNNSNVYITNNYYNIYLQPRFAFSFSWSGEALLALMNSGRDYQFLIHPKLSYISTDLISQTFNSTGSQCVASYLSSKEIMEVLQEKNFYFSPYANYSKNKNIKFKKIYKEFASNLKNLSWIDASDQKNYYGRNKSWQLIKISLNNRTGE